MIVVIPPCLYGRLGAVLSACIIVLSVIGLTMHRDFYAGIRRRDFFCFYTNVSNLLVLVYFSVFAPLLYAKEQLRSLIPHAEFAVMMCILLTFCVFHTMIYPSIQAKNSLMICSRAYRIIAVDNLIIHYFVPGLVFAYWLFSSPGKAQLAGGDVFLWTSVPVLYIACIYINAPFREEIEEVKSRYPYPFLDPAYQKPSRIVMTVLILYVLCVFTGVLILACLKTSVFFFGTGHPLILI